METPPPNSNESVASAKPDDRLDTWKEIAAYLKRDVRTVRRWEESRALPVRRHATGPRSQVYAFRSEIDAWLRHPDALGEIADPATPPPAAPSRGRSSGVPGLSAILVLLLAAVLLLRPYESPAPTDLKHGPLTAELGEEWYPTFSPEATEVGYIWRNAHGDTDIYRRAIADGAVIQLTFDREEKHCLSWSPDGRSLAFCRELAPNRSAIMLLSLGDGTERELATGFIPRDLDMGQTVAWSPDGRSVIASIDSKWSAAPGLHRIQIDSGQWTRLTQPPVGTSYGDSEPAISSDSRNLVFLRLSRRGQSELYVLRLDAEQVPEAEPARLTQTGLFTSSPSFFPGGKEILYAQGSVEGRRLFRMKLTNPGSATPLLTLSAPLWMPTLSKDGKRIAYAHRSFDTNLWNLEIDEQGQTAGQPQLVVASSRGDANPAYSPDGRWLAFDTTRSGVSEVWIAEANGANPRRIAGFPEAMCGSPAWSPDSQWLAFDARVELSSDIYVASIHGGSQPRRITTHAADDLLPGWSGDGAWIHFASNRTGNWQIWRVPTAGGDEQRLTTKGALFHRVARNGDVYTTQPEGRQEDAVMRLTSDGQETPMLPPVYWYNSFDFLGSGLVYIRKPPRPNAAATILYRDKTGGDHPVHKLSSAVGFGLSVSPDGRHIAWSQQDGNSSDLMLIDDLP